MPPGGWGYYGGNVEYSPDNKIIVKARGNQTLPIDRLMEFQGNLKRLTQKNRDKLMASILEKGFIAPIFVWDDAGEYRLLDGHQRLKTLLWMRERGWDIPMLPVDIIEADDEQDAKKKLLAITSQYGEFTTDGYAEFTNDIEIEPFVRLTDEEWLQDGMDCTTDFPELKDGDKEPFQQMTFTLADEQAEIVKEAITQAKTHGAGKSEVNENSNGNALSYICEVFLGH